MPSSNNTLADLLTWTLHQFHGCKEVEKLALDDPKRREASLQWAKKADETLTELRRHLLPTTEVPPR